MSRSLERQTLLRVLAAESLFTNEEAAEMASQLVSEGAVTFGSDGQLILKPRATELLPSLAITQKPAKPAQPALSPEETRRRAIKAVAEKFPPLSPHAPEAERLQRASDRERAIFAAMTGNDPEAA